MRCGPGCSAATRCIADLREALGEFAFAAAWAEGRGMTMEEACAYALQDDAVPALDAE
jgi:hypothetical protein